MAPDPTPEVTLIYDRRGTFTSVRDLTAALRRFIEGWNDRCEPFVWTKPADEILSKAIHKKTS